MSVAHRLVRSFGATVSGPAVTVLVQLINVPIMLRAWGPQLFGEWLMLSAIPTYLLFSDVGFGNVAGNAMTVKLHAGDRDGARSIYHSALAFVGGSTAIVALIATACLFLLPVSRVFHLHAMDERQARLVLLLLCLNATAVLHWGALMVAYRATERYATGTLIVNALRLIEGAGVLLLLLTRMGPAMLAIYMLAVTLLGTMWLALLQGHATPWLRVGFRHARWETVRGLLRPGLAYMLFPLCAALLTQGMTLVTGLELGPLAVAVFNPMRTLSRVPFQVSDAIKNSAWPELSAAFGREDYVLAKRLHRGAFQASLVLSVVLVAALWATGPLLFRLWVHGRISLQVGAFHVLLLAVLVNSLWNISSTVPISVNRHERMSAYYLVFSGIALVLAWWLAKHVGLAGVAWGMLFADSAMSLIVLRMTTRMLDDPLGSFLLACVRPVEIVALLRRLRRARSAMPGEL